MPLGASQNACVLKGVAERGWASGPALPFSLTHTQGSSFRLGGLRVVVRSRVLRKSAAAIRLQNWRGRQHTLRLLRSTSAERQSSPEPRLIGGQRLSHKGNKGAIREA